MAVVKGSFVFFVFTVAVGRVGGVVIVFRDHLFRNHGRRGFFDSDLEDRLDKVLVEIVAPRKGRRPVEARTIAAAVLELFARMLIVAVNSIIIVVVVVVVAVV
jgi:hypothetical protein